MNVLQLLDLVVQALVAIGNAAPAIETDVSDVVAALQSAYQTVVSIITSFTAPTADQVQQVQTAVDNANAVLNPGTAKK